MAAVRAYEYEKWKPVRGWKMKGAQVAGAAEYVETKDFAQPPAGGQWASSWQARGGWEYATSTEGPWAPTQSSRLMHWRRQCYERLYAKDAAPAPAPAPAPPVAEALPRSVQPSPPRAAATLQQKLASAPPPPLRASAPPPQDHRAAPPPETPATPEAEGLSSSGSDAETFELVVYENQRWRPVSGWKASHLNFVDPTPWSDVCGDGGVDRGALEVPIPQGTWVSDWQCEEADGEWKYALGFSVGGDFHRKERKTDQVRRRTWVRKYRGPASGEYLSRPDAGERVAACMVCDKAFGVARAAYSCKRCWLRVCSRCSVNSLSIAGYTSEQRVCNDCSIALGRPVEDWSPGGHLAQRFRERKSKRKTAVLERRLALHDQPAGDRTRGVAASGPGALVCLSDALQGRSAAGHVHIQLHGIRNLPAAWGGDVGTPNAQVDFYLTQHLVQSAIKMQSHNPVWGGAEGAFTLPVHDVTASVYVCVYDISPVGVRSRLPVGRMAVPLTSLRPGEARKVDMLLLPCGDAEQAGYDHAPPTPFRGVSDVTDKFGMPKPKKPLGTVSATFTVQYTAPNVLSTVPSAYFAGALENIPPPQSPRSEAGGDGDASVADIDVLKDCIARLVAQVGPPRLLKLIWSNPVVATGLAPVIYFVVYGLPAFLAPFVLAACAVINGRLVADSLSQAGDVVIYEHDNAYKEDSIFRKAKKLPKALRVVKSLQKPVGRLASQLAKASLLLSYEDTAVSTVGTAAVFAAAGVASVAMVVLSLFSTRFYVFLGALAVVVAPAFRPEKGEKAEDDEGEGPAAAAAAPGAPAGPLQRAVNFYKHVPDDMDLQHRRICEQRMAAGARAAAEAPQTSTRKGAKEL